MPSIFFFIFFFENDIFTLSPSSSSSNYKIAIVINTTTTMNNQFEALNAPKIDLPFFFFHSCDLNTTYLSLSLHNELKKLKILILKFLWFIESVRQTTYLGSRLAVDDLPFSRLAVDDLPGSRLVNAEFGKKIRTLYNKKLPNEEKSDIRTYQNAQKNPDDFLEVQTTSWKSRRLPGSPDDFLEVQTTSRKSRRLPGSPDDFVRRLPDDFQTTNRSLPDLKNLHIKSRSEKPAYSNSNDLKIEKMIKEIRERLESFRMMNITFLLQPFERRRENV
ncbi:hypothetical protein IGI04_009863 [Brassica rapa subsp. trilocularis]|uniref:Uncharacterized protein n=1 Tax=Brassica rapa subsp. trilocularis TaxID=1813537 RepID=A0ABQ7MYH5_BRACM|nr:hypothetical protein IGI04_009863 [Brassica rapa subsp. trilocularis]